MIESFAEDLYIWVLTTDIWITLASYILIFSIFFNIVNTTITLIAFAVRWTGIKINDLDFLVKVAEYNSLHAKFITMIAIIGSFLGLSRAFHEILGGNELQTEAIYAMITQMPYVFVSSLFGYVLGALWSGVIIHFMLSRLIPDKYNVVNNRIFKKELNASVKDLNHEKSQSNYEEKSNLLNKNKIRLKPCKSN